MLLLRNEGLSLYPRLTLVLNLSYNSYYPTSVKPPRNTIVTVALELSRDSEIVPSSIGDSDDLPN
jgi:hypothetical protein